MASSSGPRPTSQPDLPLVYLTRPPSAPSDGKPPLLLLLHGVGSNEHDLFSLAPRLNARFRVVSLRAPLVRGPLSFAWFDVQFLPTGFAIDPAQLDASRRTVLAFAEQAADAFDTDPAQVYLMGFSQGAIISLTVALSEPERVAGVVALSGRIPPEVLPILAAPERTAGLPVFLAHGRYDTVIPYEWAERARETLERQRTTLAFFPYPLDHQIGPDTLHDLTTWLDIRLDAPPWHA